MVKADVIAAARMLNAVQHVTGKDFHGHVAAEVEFIKSDPERLARYELLINEENRKRQLALTDAVPEQQVPQHAMVRAPGRTLETPQLTDMSGPICVHGREDTRKFAETKGKTPPLPIQEDALKAVLDKETRDGLRVGPSHQEHEEKFCAAMNNFASGAKQQGKIELMEPVPFETSAPHQRPYRARFEKELLKFVGRCAAPLKPSEFAWSDVVISCSSGPARTSYYVVASGKAQAGSLKPRLNFIELEVCEWPHDAEDPFEFMLQIKREVFIQPRRKGLPFGGEVTCGKMRHRTFTDVAAEFVGENPPTISIRKLLTSLFLADKFKARGDDNRFEVAVVVPQEAPRARAANNNPSGDEDPVDWDAGILPNAQVRQQPAPDTELDPWARGMAILDEAFDDCIPPELQELIGDEDSDSLGSGSDGEREGNSAGASSSANPRQDLLERMNVHTVDDMLAALHSLGFEVGQAWLRILKTIWGAYPPGEGGVLASRAGSVGLPSAAFGSCLTEGALSQIRFMREPFLRERVFGQA